MPASADLSVQGATKAAGGNRVSSVVHAKKTVHHDSRNIVPVSKKHCSAAANVTAAPSTEINRNAYMHAKHVIQCFVTYDPRF